MKNAALNKQSFSKTAGPVFHNILGMRIVLPNARLPLAGLLCLSLAGAATAGGPDGVRLSSPEALQESLRLIESEHGQEKRQDTERALIMLMAESVDADELRHALERTGAVDSLEEQHRSAQEKAIARIEGLSLDELLEKGLPRYERVMERRRERAQVLVDRMESRKSLYADLDKAWDELQVTVTQVSYPDDEFDYPQAVLSIEAKNQGGIPILGAAAEFATWYPDEEDILLTTGPVQLHWDAPLSDGESASFSQPLPIDSGWPRHLGEEPGEDYRIGVRLHRLYTEQGAIRESTRWTDDDQAELEAARRVVEEPEKPMVPE